MTGPMDRCLYTKTGRHELMAFYVDGNLDVPLTLACAHCGSTKQVVLTWTTVGETLDNESAAAILEATRPSRA